MARRIAWPWLFDCHPVPFSSSPLMIAPSQDSIALLVSHLGNGDPRTIEKLLERSYTRLQQLTRLMLRGISRGATLGGDR